MRGIFIAISLLISTSLLAQEQLSLQDAITKALQYNFDVRIADINAQVASTNNTLGNAGLLPTVNGTAGLNAGSANTRMEFADGRVQDVSGANTISYNAGVTLNYTIFAAGRAFVIRKQLKELETISTIQLKAQMQATVSQVIQAYAKAVWQQQQGIAIDTGLALAKTRMTLSQVKYETGASAKVDFLQARVDYNARQSDSLTQVSMLVGALADLNMLMGEDPYHSYVVDDALFLLQSLQPLAKELLIDQNLSLSIAKKNLSVAQLNAKLAKTFLYPTLNLGGGYNFNRSQSQSGFALFSQSYGPSGGLNLSVPIFQGGNLRRNAKVASLQALREELNYEKQNSDIARQYRKAWKDYEMSLAAYRLEVENINYAKENLYIQEARFRVGIATTIEVREAENGYIQALSRLNTAAYNAKVNETKVLELESGLASK